MDARPIGFFDSGVGGLTIWRAVKNLLPGEQLVYLADSANFPYGPRSTTELCAVSEGVVEQLLGLACKLIVVACNTATVAALAHLRARFPQVPFVGVVPVVKVLSEQTRTGTIALLSTPGTSSSPYLADLIARFAPGLRVLSIACEGLADRIEQGQVGMRVTSDLLDRYLAPVLASTADVVGLGCTHYPFLRTEIEQLLGPTIRVFDSADPVARRVREVLAARDALACHARPVHRFLTTGDPAAFAAIAGRLLGADISAVERVAPIPCSA